MLIYRIAEGDMPEKVWAPLMYKMKAK